MLSSSGIARAPAAASLKTKRKDKPMLVCSIRKLSFLLVLPLLMYVCLIYASIKPTLTKADGEEEMPMPKMSVMKEENQNHVRKKIPDDVITIAFATTVTGCGVNPFTEGAAVLRHSIHLASVRGPLGGRYDYKMYAFFHPDAESCTLPLADLGFTLLPRPTPVNVSAIPDADLRERLVRNGCCGEKELIKLEAYKLLKHKIVVHLDLDVVVLKPMDAVFDLMLDSAKKDKNEPLDTSNVPLMWPEREIPRPIQFFYTKDYNMVMPGRKDKPTQGGLFILRPSLKVYDEFVSIVQRGDCDVSKGWGGKVGPFYGWLTIQGLLPYYYEFLHPGASGGGVELNRCVYNQMADNPMTGRTVKDVPQGKCRVIKDVCEDCRTRPIEDIVTAHYTVCQKPWLCLPHKQNIVQMRLCRKLHHEWFRLRSDMERSWGRSGRGTGNWDSDHNYGYCEKMHGYQRIEQPYGKPAK